MKKFWVIIALLAIFVAIPPFMAKVSAAKSHKKITKVVVKKPAPKKGVKGASTYVLNISGQNYISCHMPDGKTIWALKNSCEFVNTFWDQHKPSNPGPSNSGGGSSSNGGGDTDHTDHSAEKTRITSAELMPCGSTSCGGLVTVKITGANFNSFTKAKLVNGSDIYQDSNAQLENLTPTEMIWDFDNVPACTTFSVQVYDYGQTYVSTSSITTVCH